MLHGSGANYRRYLFGADAADAFDTILHKGVPGEIYNVDSCDEASNIDIAHRMLRLFGIPEADTPKWIAHTQDRPFNDHRYAVNANKLRGLGWRQKVRLEEGLPLTVDWYRRFGRGWWMGIEGLFDSPHPEVGGEGVVGHGGSRTPLIEVQQDKMLAAATVAPEATTLATAAGSEGANGLLMAPPKVPVGAPLTVSTPAITNSLAGSNVAINGPGLKKQPRAADGESKENVDVSVDEVDADVLA